MKLYSLYHCSKYKWSSIHDSCFHDSYFRSVHALIINYFATIKNCIYSTINIYSRGSFAIRYRILYTFALVVLFSIIFYKMYFIKRDITWLSYRIQVYLYYICILFYCLLCIQEVSVVGIEVSVRYIVFCRTVVI